MKKIFGFIFLTLLVMICLSSNVFATNDNRIAIEVVSASGETIIINQSNYIFYLPSAVDITSVTLKFEGELSYVLPNGQDKAPISTDGKFDLSDFETVDSRGAGCYVVSFYNGTRRISYTFYHDSELPSVFVTTSQGLSYIEGNKSNRDKKAKIFMLENDGMVAYSDMAADSFSEIKSRGNATFGYAKKPYQIKLSKKTALFGMDKAKTWILLAGYTDQTALHNALAFTLGEELGIPYNIEYRFVNLYIDNKYRGLYIICEKVQIDENRVDIRDLEKENEKANPDQDLSKFSIKTVKKGSVIENSILSYYTYCEGMTSPSDITGGYLVELDNIRGTSEPCHFKTKNGNIYVVKSPEFASREEMEYIASLFADMEEAIFSATGYNSKGVHYSDYIDIESFAGMYTVQELLKNWDAYLGSTFFFKDADNGVTRAKIYMGPLWDMDNILGNLNPFYEYGTDTEYLWAQNGVFNSYPREFAKKLMMHDEFAEIVQEKFNVAYGAVQEYLAVNGGLEKAVEMIHDAVMMDRTRWKLYDANSWLLNYSGSKSSVKFIQFANYGTAQDTERNTALGFFRYYLSERADALLSLIGSGTYIPPAEESTEVTEIQTTESYTTEIQTTENWETTETLYHESETTSDIYVDTEEHSAWHWGYVAGAVAIIACAMGILFVCLKKRK